MDSKEAPLVAGVELGGTKCVCVLAAGPERVVAEERVPTTSPTVTMDTIERILDRWRAEQSFAAQGLANLGPHE